MFLTQPMSYATLYRLSTGRESPTEEAAATAKSRTGLPNYTSIYQKLRADDRFPDPPAIQSEAARG